MYTHHTQNVALERDCRIVFYMGHKFNTINGVDTMQILAKDLKPNMIILSKKFDGQISELKIKFVFDIDGFIDITLDNHPSLKRQDKNKIFDIKDV